MSYPKDEIQNVSMTRPHLVLLGAGVSLAAFPNGDRNGRKLPLMNDLVQVVGLESVLDETKVDYQSRNFEDIYSELHERVQYQPVVEEIESRIRAYFGLMKLPQEPTLYDHLLLSLRSKDVIATFNWDPLLSKPMYGITKKEDFHMCFFFMVMWPLDTALTTESEGL